MQEHIQIFNTKILWFSMVQSYRGPGGRTLHAVISLSHRSAVPGDAVYCTGQELGALGSLGHSQPTAQKHLRRASLLRVT